MRFGMSILLIAIGAWTTWGVDGSVIGIELSVIGVILMAVGAAGLLASLFLSSSMAPGRRRTLVAEDEPAVDQDDRTPIDPFRR